MKAGIKYRKIKRYILIRNFIYSSQKNIDNFVEHRIIILKIIGWTLIIYLWILSI